METSIDFQVDYLPRLPQNLKIGIGCIGSGFIMADCHLVAYRRSGFNPVAIASRNRLKWNFITILLCRHIAVTFVMRLKKIDETTDNRGSTTKLYKSFRSFISRFNG
jgi:predicted dehydrogenase